jgi:hypothetical protein
VIEFDRILLEKEQRDLLVTMVEAARSLPRDRRQPIIVLTDEVGAMLVHPGVPQGTRIYFGDLDPLARAQLIHITSHIGPSGPTMVEVEVTPEGVAYYAELKSRSGQPIERVQTTIKAYLGAAAFNSRHANSYAKWSEAEQMLWNSDSQADLTTIGHKCREALQLFATELVNRHRPPGVDPDPAKTKNRIAAVVGQQKDRLSQAQSSLFDALLWYWEAVVDLSQRQEHGAQKEGVPLASEDARRTVFQTAVVMFELDRTLT